MDEIDTALLAGLFRAPLASLTELGREVGLTRNAVKARLDGLAKAGVYSGIAAVVNPRLFDREGVVVLFNDQAESGFGAALAIPDVMGASLNHENVLAAICYVPPGAAPPAALETALDAPMQRQFRQAAPPLTPRGTALSALEWRLLAAIVAAPRASNAQLGEAAGVTAKTAARHRDALVRRGALRYEPGVNAARSRGAVLFELFVQGPAALTPGAIENALKDCWVLDRTSEPPGLLALTRAAGLGDAVALERSITRLAGVEHAELVLSKAGGWAHAKMASWCRDQAHFATGRGTA